MSLTIVAIPREDDVVWNISSEKIPHMTILFLGDSASDQEISHISEFVGYAANLMLDPFELAVDYRGELGEDQADVLFFKKDWSIRKIVDFRNQLLADSTIRSAFESVEQFPEWTPHLTLGFPETPAKPDTRDYTRIHWVEFDNIAFWTGDFTGSEFRLKQDNSMIDEAIAMTAMGKDFLEHHGVKGMKWGRRRSKAQLQRSSDAQRHADNAKKHLGELSDKDLKDLHNRLQTEANVRKLQGTGRSSAQKTIDKLNKTNATLGLVGAPSLAVISKVAAAPVIAAGAAVAIKLISTKGAVNTIAQF